MAFIEGVLFGGYLLVKDEFITIFQEWYNQHWNALQAELANILTTARTPGQLYRKWDEIESKYFHNPLVQIQFIRPNLTNNNVYQWTALIPESDMINNTRITGTKTRLQQHLLTAAQAIQAQNLEAQLNMHYHGMQRSLEHKVDKTEARQLHEWFGKQRFTNLYNHFTEKTLNELIYNGLNNGAYRGQAEGKRLDAFMNHLANHHQQLFTLFQKPWDDEEKIPDKIFNKSVYAEEGFRGFVHLLINGLNTTSWFTGGDIVIVNNQRKVIYNIQLKSTQKQGAYFDIATTELTAIFTLLQETKLSSIEMAEKLYEKLKTTSSNSLKQHDITDNEILALVRKNLGLKN